MLNKDKLIEIAEMERNLSKRQIEIYEKRYEEDKRFYSYAIFYFMFFSLWGGHKVYLKKYVQFWAWFLYVIIIMFILDEKYLEKAIEPLVIVWFISAITLLFEVRTYNIRLKYRLVTEVKEIDI